MSEQQVLEMNVDPQKTRGDVWKEQDMDVRVGIVKFNLLGFRLLR